MPNPAISPELVAKLKQRAIGALPLDMRKEIPIAPMTKGFVGLRKDSAVSRVLPKDPTDARIEVPIAGNLRGYAGARLARPSSRPSISMPSIPGFSWNLPNLNESVQTRIDNAAQKAARTVEDAVVRYTGATPYAAGKLVGTKLNQAQAYRPWWSTPATVASTVSAPPTEIVGEVAGELRNLSLAQKRALMLLDARFRRLPDGLVSEAARVAGTGAGTVAKHVPTDAELEVQAAAGLASGLVSNPRNAVKLANRKLSPFAARLAALGLWDAFMASHGLTTAASTGAAYGALQSADLLRTLPRATDQTYQDELMAKMEDPNLTYAQKLTLAGKYSMPTLRGASESVVGPRAWDTLKNLMQAGLGQVQAYRMSRRLPGNRGTTVPIPAIPILPL